jgi:hypothetical protein
MRVGRAVPFLGVVIALVALMGVPRFPGDAFQNSGQLWSGSRIAFQEGEELWFTIRASFDLSLSRFFESGKATSGRMLQHADNQTSVSGILFGKVIERDTARAQVGFQLLDVSCPEEAIGNPGCREVYGAPFLVTITPDGEWERYVFSNELSHSEEKKVRGLFEYFSVNFKGQGKRGSWSADERDVTGVAAVQYSTRDEKEFHRRRIKYLSFHDGDGFIDTGRFHRSMHSILLAPSRSWIRQMRVSEESHFSKDGGERFVLRSEISLDATAPRAKAPAWANVGVRQLHAMLTQGTKRVASRTSEARARAAISTSSLDPNGAQRIIAGLRGPMTSFETLTRCREATEFMTHHPELLSKVSEFLKDPSLDPMTALRMVYVVQNVDTSGAQKVLTPLVDATDVAGAVRKGAIAALGFMKITKETERKLWNITDDHSSSRQAHDREMALVALGSAARTFLDADPERSRSIVAALRERLARSLAAGKLTEVGSLYLALGATRSDEVAATLEEGLKSQAEQLRIAAATALSNFGELPNPDSVAHRVLEEKHPRVRTELIKALLKSEASEESFVSIAQAFTKEVDGKVRVAMAHYLVKAANQFPQQRSHVRTLLRMEGDPDVIKVLSDTVVGG